MSKRLTLQELEDSNDHRAQALFDEYSAALSPIVVLDAKLDGIIRHLSCQRMVAEEISKSLDIAEQQAAQVKEAAVRQQTLQRLGLQGDPRGQGQG